MMHSTRYEPEFECLANVRCADIQDTAAEGAHFVTHDDSDAHEEGIIVAYHVSPHNPDDDDF